MAAEWVEIRVVFKPLPKLGSDTRKRPLQQVERLVDVAQFGVAAGQVVLRKRVIGINRDGAGHPFPGAVIFTDFQERGDAQVSRPRILRMLSKLLLSQLYTLTCRLLAIF